MKRSIILLSILAVSVLHHVSAQQPANNAESPDFTESVSEAFVNYYKHGGLQEKLYLVTDRPYYSAGETIYFSAFLLHSIFMTPLDGSSFIYVELIGADGELITRLKVKGEKGRFDNAMPLSPRLAPGRYTLRAYSRWMTNFDDAFLFRKQIEIGNYIDDAIQPRISYSMNDDRSVAARIRFVDDNDKPIARCRVEYSLLIGGKSSTYAAKTDDNGVVTFRLKPSDDPGDCMRIRIEANNRKLERTVQIPSFSDDFDLKFMPEGGNLISGISQIIAFKAVGSDGLSTEVDGYVSDAAGNRLCDLTSRHDGMGIFLFTPYAGETYTVTATSERGTTKSFTLPQALASGCALHVKHAPGNMLLMKVLTTPDIPASRLAAVIQARGMVECVIENIGKITRLPLSQMIEGVAQISIVDKQTKSIVAERLFFVEKGNHAAVSILPGKRNFRPRQKITLDIEVRDSNGEPATGDFALTATDAGVVGIDPSDGNILTYLLLSSDLRGYIENPAYYFESEDPDRADNLDLVMLTHGWRRYNLAALLNGQLNEIRYPVEETQRITGSVTGAIGKVKEPSVMIFEKDNQSKSRYSGIFPLNASNRFTITGIDVPDTAYYYIQALNRRGHSRSVRVKVDPETFPPTDISPIRPRYDTKAISIPEDYLVRSKESYYNDGGMRVIDIDPIVVTAQRQVNYSYSTVIDEFNTMRGELDGYASIYDALQRFHKLNVVGSTVTVKSLSPRMEQTMSPAAEGEEATGTETFYEVEAHVPGLFVNGMLTDISALDMYDISEVRSLSYVDATDAAFLGGGADLRYGAIILEVKNLHAAQSAENLAMAKVLVPGYCKPAEFYAPDYTVPATDGRKDLRTTIAWEPRLRSVNGHISVSFWSADRRNDYDITVEGVTDSGEVCRATCRLKAVR